MELLEFSRKDSVILINETENTLEKCTGFYKKMRQVHERCRLASAAKINDFSNKDQLVTYLQDRLHEDEQYIQKMEVISEYDVKTWISQASVSNYILEDLFRTTLEKVTGMESQLGVHEVTLQMMEPLYYRTIVEEADAWGEYVASLAGST